MTLNKYLWCLLAIATCPAVTSAQDAPPQWVTEGPYVDARTFSLELPIELLASKIGVEPRFFFKKIGVEPRFFFNVQPWRVKALRFDPRSSA